MNLHRRLAIAIAAALLPASALAAQAPAPAPAAPGAAPCELHLWPAERMRSMSTGLLGGGLLDAAIHAGTDASNRSQMASALDSPSQLDALQSLNLITELALPEGTNIIRHETPLDRHTMNSIKTRRSDSTARCYYELHTADALYMKSTIYGRSLRTLFMLRAFGDDQHIDFEYKAWGGNRLHHFPPGEGEDVTVAVNELVDVFKANFQEYARNEREAGTRRRN
jgi:uncharacterized protein YheU (UPF0270 family)